MNLLFEFRHKGTTFFLDTQTQISQISTIFAEKSKKRQLFGNGDAEHRTPWADVGRADVGI